MKCTDKFAVTVVEYLAALKHWQGLGTPESRLCSNLSNFHAEGVPASGHYPVWSAMWSSVNNRMFVAFGSPHGGDEYRPYPFADPSFPADHRWKGLQEDERRAEFVKSEIAWAEDLINYGEHLQAWTKKPEQNYGLCLGLPYLKRYKDEADRMGHRHRCGKTLKRRLLEHGLDTQLPFNATFGDYAAEATASAAHLNKARVAFVHSELAFIGLPALTAQ